MKLISCIYIALLLSPVLYSCNGNRSDEDSIVMEDVFEIDVFKPNDEVIRSIDDSLSSIIPPLFEHLEDSICIQIECHASWNTSSNPDPYSITINEVDTNWFFVTINEGLNAETILDWDKPSDRLILRTIKKILDAGTYVLCCTNIDNINPQSILNMYHDFDSMARTDIDFKMCLRNRKDLDI